MKPHLILSLAHFAAALSLLIAGSETNRVLSLIALPLSLAGVITLVLRKLPVKLLTSAIFGSLLATGVYLIVAVQAGTSDFGEAAMMTALLLLPIFWVYLASFVIATVLLLRFKRTKVNENN